MRNAATRYSTTKKGLHLRESLSSFEGDDSGSPNGCAAIRSMGWKVSRIGVEPQRGFGEGLRNPWLRPFWPLGRSWNRTRQNVRPFLGLDLRSSAGNSSKGMCAMFLPCLRLPGSFGDTAKPIKSHRKPIGVRNPIPLSNRKTLENSTKPTWWGPGFLEGQRVSPDSTLSIRWTWQAIPPQQPSLRIKEPSLCVDTSSQAGPSWGVLGSPKWTTRWPLRAEAAIPIAFPKSYASICSWGSTLSLSLKENPVGMPRWKASMPCGRTESSEGTIARPLPNSEKPQSDSCTITITKNPTDLLAKKKTAQGFQDASGISVGGLSGICQGRFPCTAISTLLDTSVFPLQRVKSHGPERWTPTGKSNSTAQLISSEKSLKANMWLALFTPIENAWWSNKGLGSLSRSLSPSEAPLSIPCYGSPESGTSKFAML